MTTIVETIKGVFVLVFLAWVAVCLGLAVKGGIEGQRADLKRVSDDSRYGCSSDYSRLTCPTGAAR